MTSDSTVYREEQQFTQAFLWLVIYASTALVVWMDIQYWILDDPVREDQLSATILIIVTLIMLVVLITFWIFTLITEIRKDGIYYRFYPVHGSFRRIPWGEIESLELRTYNAMMEYQGWGLRYSMTGKGWAYNVKGNKGLQIIKKDGTRILLGTQESKKLEKILKRMQGHLLQ